MEAGKGGGQGHGWIIRAAVGRGLNAWGGGEIEAELKKAAGSRKFAEAAEAFSNIVYEQADSLKPAAETSPDELIKGSPRDPRVVAETMGVAQLESDPLEGGVAEGEGASPVVAEY